MKAFLLSGLLLAASACTCDQRFLLTGNDCKTDVNGWQEGTKEYAADKAVWKQQLALRRITPEEYRHNLGYY